jgi:hypothetical protein
MRSSKQFGLLTALSLLFFALGCASISGDPGNTSIHVTGPADAHFSVDYWQHGKHLRFSGTLPWDFEGTHLSRVELRKGNPADVFTVETHYSNGNCQTMITRTIGAGTSSASIAVGHGLTMSHKP